MCDVCDVCDVCAPFPTKMLQLLSLTVFHVLFVRGTIILYRSGTLIVLLYYRFVSPCQVTVQYRSSNVLDSIFCTSRLLFTLFQ